MLKKMVVVREKRTREIIRVVKDVTEAMDFIREETRQSKSLETTVDPQSDFAQLMGGNVPFQPQELAFEVDFLTELEFHNYLLTKRMGL